MRRSPGRIGKSLLLLLPMLLAAIASGLVPERASAHAIAIVYNFCCNRLDPGQIVLDQVGNIFGVVRGGPQRAHGVVFELTRAGHYKELYVFCRQNDCADGDTPVGALVIDMSGNLYGTTTGGGAQNQGVAFELSPSGGRHWSYQKLHDFCLEGGNACTDGNLPGALTYVGAASGAPYDGVSPLFGMTAFGGANQDIPGGGGLAYELVPNSGGSGWTYSVIYSFCAQGGNECTDGGRPYASLLADSGGNLFGTTVGGGANHPVGVADGGGGTVFELSPAGESWNESVLYSFCAQPNCTDGLFPWSTLVRDASGNLYGSTTGVLPCSASPGGVPVCGVVFEIGPDGNAWQEAVLHTFCLVRHCRDGNTPTSSALLLDLSGNLFGTTEYGGAHYVPDDNEGGVLFELSNSSYTILHSFCTVGACADGSNPVAGVVWGQKGRLLGTTLIGGTPGTGTVFQIKP